MRAVEKGGGGDGEVRGLPDGFANDDAAQAVSDECDGAVALSDLCYQFIGEGFYQVQAAVPVRVNFAWANGITDSLPQALPAEVISPDAIENQCLHICS